MLDEKMNIHERFYNDACFPDYFINNSLGDVEMFLKKCLNSCFVSNCAEKVEMWPLKIFVSLTPFEEREFRVVNLLHLP